MAIAATATYTQFNSVMDGNESAPILYTTLLGNIAGVYVQNTGIMFTITTSPPSEEDFVTDYPNAHKVAALAP